MSVHHLIPHCDTFYVSTGQDFGRVKTWSTLSVKNCLTAQPKPTTTPMTDSRISCLEQVDNNFDRAAALTADPPDLLAQIKQ